MIKGIIFADDFSKYINSSTFIGVLNDGIVSKEEFILDFKEKFQFPHGSISWDSLDDLLSDFQWLDATRVLIVHKSIPSLINNDLKIYLDILSKVSFYDPNRDLKRYFKKYKVKSFDGVIAIMPSKYKDMIEVILKS